LPAFAAVLKIRSKKLAQTDTSSKMTSVTTSSTSNLLFIDSLALKLNNIIFYRKNLQTDINLKYSNLLFKDEAVTQFKFLALTQFKIVTFFI
jgi:hypothetical protein